MLFVLCLLTHLYHLKIFWMLNVYTFNVTVGYNLHVLALDYTAVAVSGKVGPVKPVNHTSWVAVVTPTDRPKSVRNCCLIELFCGVVCVVTLSLWHFCWYRGFCHRTGSDLLLFVFISKFDNIWLWFMFICIVIIKDVVLIIPICYVVLRSTIYFILTFQIKDIQFINIL